MNTLPNKTTTETYWMIAVFINGTWDHDIGRFVDREDAEERITETKTRYPAWSGWYYFPYRCTETITKEYDAK